ncbi:hypothetical protein MVEN_00100700 [Mycena venus]|uniref:Uncharacterized protein n=1 Tax=Mycena venus TaxID=2733690 RepID=A0A8H6Z4Y4_9AGAR|nr:hypothetical protein MVEN_00100700 [Mycena venus]
MPPLKFHLSLVRRPPTPSLRYNSSATPLCGVTARTHHPRTTCIAAHDVCACPSSPSSRPCRAYTDCPCPTISHNAFIPLCFIVIIDLAVLRANPAIVHIRGLAHSRPPLPSSLVFQLATNAMVPA